MSGPPRRPVRPEAAAPPLVQALRALADDPRRERIQLSDVVAALGDGTTLVLVLVFALPNALPMPPGTSAVLGAPLLCLTVEWALGLRPWLPGVLGRRSIGRPALDAAASALATLLARTDTLLAPRLATFARPPFERIAACLCAVLAAFILLPIPFGNMPPAWAICVVVLGVLRGDGLWVRAGTAVGCGSIALAWRVALGLAAAAWTRVEPLLR